MQKEILGTQMNQKIKQINVHKNPIVIEWEKWILSEEEFSCSDPTKIMAPSDQRQYIENRLYRAFLAGVRAKEIADKVSALCNCSKCLSARLGKKVKSVEDYYKED